MHSVFWRASKYLASSAGVDPRENRLTETFASVLERVPDLPFAFVEFVDPSLRRDPAKWRAAVRTQQKTWGGGIIDLELVLTPRRAPNPSAESLDELFGSGSVVCWVEVKHGAGLSGADQLTEYLRDIEETGADTAALCLLAPREADIYVDDPRIALRTWQQWARVLARYRWLSRPTRIDPVEDWLIGQLLTYLQEEALMDEERLTIEHAFILAALPTTVNVMTSIWDVIDTHVQLHWGPRASRAPQTNPNFHYRSYKAHPKDQGLAPTWGTHTTLSWGTASDSFLDEPRISVVFWTGISIESGVPRENYLDRKENATWLAVLEAQGFRRLLFDGSHRLWKLRYADELLIYGSLEEQSRAMADWVLESFQTAIANPPPVGAAEQITAASTRTSL